MTQLSARQGALARLLLTCGVLLVGVAACTKVGSDPDAPVAIELRPTPLPSIVVGDSMRDSTGAVVPLRVLVFNSSNDTIPGAPVRFLNISSEKVITLDSITGAIVAGPDTGRDSVVASVGSLQSAPINVVVVPSPDTLFPVSSLVDTLEKVVLSVKVTQPVTVRLGHHNPDSVIAVSNYLVHYTPVYPPEFTPPADTTALLLVDDSGCPGSVLRCVSFVDTTDATGNATRSLQIAPFTSSTAFPDSLMIRVDAYQYAAPTTPMPGSPLTFLIRFQNP